MAFEREVEFLKQIAGEAGHLALEYQRKGISAETKEDESPVTAADKACEKMLVEAIGRQFPDDGILGEEGASKDSTNGRKWIVDPIDGTRDYVRGMPLWANLIGLEQDGEVVAGVANCPTQNLMCWASKGGGTFANGARAQVSGITEQSQAVLCFNGFHKSNVPAMGQQLLNLGGQLLGGARNGRRSGCDVCRDGQSRCLGGTER